MSTMERTATYDGTPVHTGRGGGLASAHPEIERSHMTFQASRLPELGDTILAVTRTCESASHRPRTIELRAFAASAPGRGALAQLTRARFLGTAGALGWAAIELNDGAATLERCIVTDAAPTAGAARTTAEWLRTAWESELRFGGVHVITGTMEAFAVDGGEPADWSRDWLEATEHRLDDGPAGWTFLKVLSMSALDSADADGESN
jgi:hypothetical protein